MDRARRSSGARRRKAMVSSALSVHAAGREAGDRAALVFGDTTWTWSRLASEVEAEIEILTQPGTFGVFDAVAEPATIVRIFALLELGIPFVPLNPGLTRHERSRQLDVLRALFDLEVDLGRSVSDADPMAILFTSGSSGSPRAVELSRGAFKASAGAGAARLGWQEDDRWLCCLPIAHVAGLSILTRCLIARRTIVLIPRFDPAAVVDAIDQHAVTLISLVPAMLARLLRRAGHRCRHRS